MVILVILDMDISYNSMFRQSDAFFTLAIFLLLSLPAFSGPLYDLNDDYIYQEMSDMVAIGDEYLEEEDINEETDDIVDKNKNLLHEDDYIRFFLIFSLVL